MTVPPAAQTAITEVQAEASKKIPSCRIALRQVASNDTSPSAAVQSCPVIGNSNNISYYNIKKNSIHTWQINVLRASLKKTPAFIYFESSSFIYKLNGHFTCRQHHHIGKPAGSVVFHLLFLLCSLKHIVISRKNGVQQDSYNRSKCKSCKSNMCACDGKCKSIGNAKTAVITRLRERVRSTLFSTTLRTPTAEIIP